MKTRNKAKHILSAALSAVMLLGGMPTFTYAAQVNEYIDPADVWVSANGRTNELDFNATITQETGWCTVCNKDTIMLTYRTPEYTKSGTTALNRGVRYSDGTMVDGQIKGNLDNGTPNQDATYTTYHFTKSVCQTCGTINSVDGEGDYCFSKNIYSLNSCDHNFFLDFDNTTYEPYSSTKHTTTLKRGKYCQFCKGTQARATQSLENHHFTETIDGQLGNNRFYVSEHCDDCGYETSEYITAKSVVSSYYGNADGSAHTVTVSDLSDSGVHTSIRYGTSAGKCNLTSAPNYTEAGYYPVYYEIDYKYDGKNMTENGVSYVWLLEENKGDTIIIVPPTNTEEKHTHDFRYLETVAPSCDNLGYERWQCDGCGSLEKRNYTPATGHDYENITIREATCKQGGLSLSLCKDCGDFHQETTPMGEHKYRAEKHNPTCRMTGYTEYVCEVCGDSYMNNITPIISHSFERITKEPTCTDKGYTTSTCTMCGLNYVSDYTEPTGHNWDEGHAVTNSTCESEGVTEFHCLNCDEKMIKSESATGHTPGKAATCTEPQTCEKCGTVLELPKGHTYSETVIAPTCEAMGYSVFECTECGDSYTGNFTDKAEHDYNTVVTAPTCTQHGFTTYTCKNCNDEYISDYTEKIPHDYKAEITNPTCTEFGHTTYICSVCGESYTADYTDKLPHNYNKQVIPPTCTEHGYTIYTCPDCGNEYIGDLTECEQHKYTETVIEPTCTEMGYTIFTCETCGDSYKGNYTDKIPHNYIKTVTEPTCTEHGFTTFVCADCGDTYKSEYTEAAGHKPSDWIIDTPATIEHGGSKHTQCTVCGNVLQTVELAQLVDKDNSDEDGNAKVGRYAIVLTDKDGKPVFNSEITIDKDDNISIKLPEGRLLDYADRTTITVVNTENQTAAKDLNIFIADTNGNNATGITDANGQLIVPNNQSSTGDDNGTIGKDENDSKFTYVVKVTDKANVTIPNCETYIGESNNVVVKLPDGLILTQDSPAIIHIADQNGVPQKDVTVIVIADKDYIEKGVTDMYGKLTVPPVNSGYTDKDGKVSVQGYYVFVADESKNIENALVTLNEDNSFTVLLPAESLIDYANRMTVTVLDKDGNPVKDMNVTVKDVSENEKSGVTDDNGKMTVPPLSEDYTDSEGKAIVNEYNILVVDETSPIENAFINIAEDGKISVTLPAANKIDIHNRISVTVTDNEDKPVKGLTVSVSETAAENAETEAKTAEDVTDDNGKITVPPTNTDRTDTNGYAQVIENENGYNIVVEDTKTKIENAYVEIKDSKISVVLPDEHKLDTANQTTVTVMDKDNKPVSGISVTVKDKTTEKTAATNSSGKVTLPVKTSGGSIGGGSSRPSGGGGSYISNTTNITVTDKDGKTVSVSKSTDSKGNITLTLPNGKELANGNYYTIKATDSKGNAKSEVNITLKDKNNSASGITDKNGVVILPATEHKSYIVGYEDGTFRPDGDMTRAEAAAIFARLISEKKAENISGTKTGFTDISKNEWYTSYISYLEKYNIIKGYEDNTFRPDEAVTRVEFVSMTVRYYGLFDKVSYPANTTKYSDISGSHWAVKDISFAKNIGWLNGYADGTFRPDNNITRAEVVTVVNHATGRYADKEYINKNLSVLNKFTDLKNNSHWGYYEIMESANTHKAVSSSDTETWVR